MGVGVTQLLHFVVVLIWTNKFREGGGNIAGPNYISGPKSSGLVRHRRFNFFTCNQILPANLKAMPAEQANLSPLHNYN